MPRIRGDGVHYVPIDSKIFDDVKIRRLTSSFGSDGPDTYIHLLLMIFRENYYLEISLEDLACDLHYEIRFNEKEKDINYVLRILKLMMRLNLIDSDLAEKGVITSKGIQKQFMAITYRRKEKERPYWLLTPEEEEKTCKEYGSCSPESKKIVKCTIDSNNTVIDSNNGLNVAEEGKKTAKGNKGKGKEKVKGKEDKNDKYDKGNYPGFLDFFTACLIEDKMITIYDPNIPKYNDFFQDIKESYKDMDLILRCFRYCRDYVKRNIKNIDDRFNYFKTALTNSLAQMEGYDDRMQNWRERIEEILRGVR